MLESGVSSQIKGKRLSWILAIVIYWRAETLPTRDSSSIVDKTHTVSSSSFFSIIRKNNYRRNINP